MVKVSVDALSPDLRNVSNNASISFEDRVNGETSVGMNIR